MGRAGTRPWQLCPHDRRAPHRLRSRRPAKREARRKAWPTGGTARPDTPFCRQPESVRMTPTIPLPNAHARDAARSALLSAHGWRDDHAAPLAGDASARRYLRLTAPGRTAVLMDADPAAGEDVRPFIAITASLRARGLSAPDILGSDLDAGFLLLEDLGDDLFARVCTRDASAEPALYAAAVDLLAAMHRDMPATPTEAATIGPYDMAVLVHEAALVPDWLLPASTGAATPADLRGEYLSLVAAACAPVAVADAAQPGAALVLRDYHAENLIWLPDRVGHARVGLLDHQDALIGRPAYDLASLLEDARRDTSADLRAAMMTRYADAAGLDAVGRDALATEFAILAAQRNLKILGIFTRLCIRDGKPGYVDLLPRVWAHLQRDLAHPALAGLRAFVAAHVPAPDAAMRARLKSLTARTAS
ncbi:MAG: aminoglycoside/choline kinase family phosphotransferase [Paracoccaceae bacterium]|jgi:aminoglycoside/choline kinase family phosphotransferase